MPNATVNKNGTWIRYIHDTWENQNGYRTDIRLNTLHNNPDVKRAAFILDDYKAIIVPIEEMRRALKSAPVRDNGCVGPFYISPISSRLNDVSVQMEIKDLPRPPKA